MRIRLWCCQEFQGHCGAAARTRNFHVEKQVFRLRNHEDVATNLAGTILKRRILILSHSAMLRPSQLSESANMRHPAVARATASTHDTQGPADTGRTGSLYSAETETRQRPEKDYLHRVRAPARRRREVTAGPAQLS